jgi:hypothetical protein
VIIAGAQNIVLTNKIFTSGNYTWDLGTEFSWVSAEISASIICASAGSLKPLFSRYLPFLTGSQNRRYGTGSSNQRQYQVSQPTWRSKKSRVAEDAFELESADGHDSKKATDDDEATLWNGGAFRREHTITAHSDLTEAQSGGNRTAATEKTGKQSYIGSRANGGISVTQDVSISYQSK